MKKDAFETSNQTNFSVFDENEDIRQKRKKLISEFSGYTTLHGLHFLIDSGSLFRKVFWMILLLVMFTCFFIQLVESYKRLKEYGSNLSKGVESPEEVTFPAITICNQNMMRKSLVMGTDAQKYLDGQDIMKIKLGAAQFSNESFEVDKMVREKGHLFESMLFECSFAGATCTPENFTTLLSFTRGLCYTFNSGTNNTPVFTARAADIRMAFSAMLFSQPEEYYGPFSHRATGFKIAIHDQNETPDIDLDSYDLSPGFATNIRLIREKAKYLPAPYSSNCSSKRGIDGGTYSETGCLTRCYNNLMTSQCQCKILGHESDYKNITGFCSTYQLKACVYEAWMVLRPQNCDCPKPCTSLKYKAQISTSYFPSESLWESLIPLLGQSSLPFVNLTGRTLEQATAEAQVNVRKSVCMVNVFFETLVTDILEEKPSYDLTMFGADLGGTMGLFLGCSILTICEFIDLVIILVANGWRKGKARVIDVKEKPEARP
ncbi:acid-sensing ion channel 3 isoform X2 [Nematostella vectensis]|nr:acid-sensing ion channel 3 isoform X2 [Nematostella vectensis]